MLYLLRRLAAALVLSLALLASATFAASPDPSSSPSSSPPVNIRLRAPWQSPPLLLEILEAVNTEDAAAFQPFLVELTTNGAYHAALAGGSAKDVYEAAQSALDSLGLLKDEGARQNWQISLALHSESAKVAAFFQLAETSGSDDRWSSRVRAEEDEMRSKCGSWVDWYGDVVCTGEELETSLKSSASQNKNQKVATYPFDHLLQSEEAAANVPIAVLYGDLRVVRDVDIEAATKHRASEEGVTWQSNTDGKAIILLDTLVRPNLQAEGLARELVNRINRARKRAGFVATDAVDALYSFDTSRSDAAGAGENVEALRSAWAEYGDYLEKSLRRRPKEEVEVDERKAELEEETEINDVVLKLRLVKV